MIRPDPAAQADSIVKAERALRPRWRDSSGKPAPAWFRGEELDLVDRAERRQLYDAAATRIGPVPWQQFVAFGAMGVALTWRGVPAWHWTHGLAAAVLLAGATISTLLRRRTIRHLGRAALRESADWPQRLEKMRA